MDEYEIKARGKPPKTYRLTGRDGPLGLFETTSGVPAWLAEEGKDKGRGRGQPSVVRGKPEECMNAIRRECMNEDLGKGPNARGMPGEWVNATMRECVNAGMCECVNGSYLQPVTSNQQQVARGHPPDIGMIVIPTKKSLSRFIRKERSVALKAESNRFLTRVFGFGISVRGKPATRGKPPDVRDRGHPPEAEYGAFHRVNLPVIGEVCAGSRDIEQR